MDSACKNYAPVVLFTYDRLEHTKRTLNALAQNVLAEETDIYIYSDAPKNNRSVEEVNSVRTFLYTLKGFKSITIVEREKNYGLAENIIDGVTSLCEKYGMAIVVEDDIVTSKYFLKYMNDALQLYKDNERVMAISGFFPPGHQESLPETFFLPWFDCWGWATWNRAWRYFERNPERIVKEFPNEQIKRLNYNGTEDVFGQIVQNNKGTLYTWAAFFFVAIFEHNGLVLYPNKNLVMNIGFDGTGENCGKSNSYERELDNFSVDVERIQIETCKKTENIVAEFFSKINKKTIIEKIYGGGEEDNEDIAVIIPVYNRAHTISKCIASVLKQTLLPKEIICVDDCSSDNSKDVILRMLEQTNSTSIKYYCLKKNSGANVARSYGIQQAKSKWIAFLDSDDEWLPTKLEKQMKVVRENCYLEELVVHSNCEVINHMNGNDYLWELPFTNGYASDVHKQLLCSSGPMFQGMLTSKAALENVGFLDGAVPAYQEWDTSLLLSKKCKFIHLKEGLFIYHIHNESVFRNLDRDFWGYQYILDKWKKDIDLYCDRLTQYKHYKTQILKLINLKENKRAEAYIERELARYNICVRFFCLCAVRVNRRFVRVADVMVYGETFGIKTIAKKCLAACRNIVGVL